MLGYDDIYLIPQKSVVASRKECDTSVTIGDHIFELPIVPANMKTIINKELALELAERGYFYIMHRFADDLELFSLEFSDYMRQHSEFLSLSFGVSQCSYDAMRILYINGLKPEFITLDIAHAHSVLTEDFVKAVKEYFPSTYLIAGNVVTHKATLFLQHLGVDMVKVGIAQGANCITYNKTGFGVPQYTAIDRCSLGEFVTVPTIADGGIRENGHIAKALTRADLVMIGSMFAGYPETAGEIIEIDGDNYKVHAGSASSYIKGEAVNVEGKKSLHKVKQESLFDKYSEIKQDLQSAISYAGGTSLEALWTVEYGVVK